MSAIVMHPATAEALERFTRHHAHAVLVVGPEGVGKETCIRLLMRRLLDLPDNEALDKYPYIQALRIPKDKSSIGIDEIRELQRFATLKLPGNSDTTQPRRMLVVYDAHTLTTEAQNALLKLLEEPPKDTILLLSAAEEDALLPTIRSRTQRLQIHRPARAEVTDFFRDAGYDADAVKQTAMLSGGLPGLQHALLQDEDHPLKQAVATARTILQADSFKRLCMVDELSKKKPDCLRLLFVLQHMSQAAIDQAATGDNTEASRKRLKQWHRILTASYRAEQALRGNTQAKLVLDDLLLAF